MNYDERIHAAWELLENTMYEKKTELEADMAQMNEKELRELRRSTLELISRELYDNEIEMLADHVDELGNGDDYDGYKATAERLAILELIAC